MNRALANRSERWARERWPAIRAGGFARFLLLKGVLLWGGIMFAALVVMVTLRLGIQHPRLPLLIALAAVLCAIGGAVWAALSWWLNERLFRSLNTFRQNP